MPGATRLRETDVMPRRDAQVIDADFVVIRAGAPRTFFGKLKLALAIAGVAAMLGALTPPLVIAAATLAEALS